MRKRRRIRGEKKTIRKKLRKLLWNLLCCTCQPATFFDFYSIVYIKFFFSSTDWYFDERKLICRCNVNMFRKHIRLHKHFPSNAIFHQNHHVWSYLRNGQLISNLSMSLQPDAQSWSCEEKQFLKQFIFYLASQNESSCR